MKIPRGWDGLASSKPDKTFESSSSLPQALPVLYPSLRAVINTLTFTQLVSILQDFTTSLPDSTDSRLTLACQNKVCTFSLFPLLILILAGIQPILELCNLNL